MTDKVAEWQERISQEPQEEVANVEYMDLLWECRIIEDR